MCRLSGNLEASTSWSLKQYKSCRRRPAATRAIQARQALSEVPDKERYPRPPGWGMGVRLTVSPRKYSVWKPWQRKSHDPTSQSATAKEEENYCGGKRKNVWRLSCLPWTKYFKCVRHMEKSNFKLIWARFCCVKTLLKLQFPDNFQRKSPISFPKKKIFGTVWSVSENAHLWPM
jgi:hypothetical protein